MVNIPTLNEASAWFNRVYGAYPEGLSTNGTLALTYTLIPNISNPFLQDRSRTGTNGYRIERYNRPIVRRKTIFTHIAYKPEILSGKPHIMGTRLSIEFILELFASGATKDEVLKAYPQLTAEAIEEALKYAAQSVKNEILLDVKVGV
ncbi:MAG TPA: DUF433 domain-containing protein [Anaerolineales bacterium]|nr:DUF433 domain-containing protein [Anaerolineales bacterium]